MSRRLELEVVVVSHDHSSTIDQTLESLRAQKHPADRVLVVDCASFDSGWICRWEATPGFECVRLDFNAGFTGGNNEGWRRLRSSTDLVLFLNPDMILPPDLLERMRVLMSEERSTGYGAVCPRLMGWDFRCDRPTRKTDSTGIFPNWYGGWQDRGEFHGFRGDPIEPVPAICGAFFLARMEALRGLVTSDRGIWDDRYFAYKEDIELSLRLRRAGWKIGLWHGGEAYHGRGWKRRSDMDRSARLLSARNEIRLHWDYRPERLPFSVLKWALVKCFNR